VPLNRHSIGGQPCEFKEGLIAEIEVSSLAVRSGTPVEAIGA
jgi:hypothetical protein